MKAFRAEDTIGIVWIANKKLKRSLQVLHLLPKSLMSWNADIVFVSSCEHLVTCFFSHCDFLFS